MIQKNSVVLGYLSKDRTELMSWFTSVIRPPVTRIVGFTLFVEVLFEQDVQNIFKERKINCSLTYVIHSTQK